MTKKPDLNFLEKRYQAWTTMPSGLELAFGWCDSLAELNQAVKTQCYGWLTASNRTVEEVQYLIRNMYVLDTKNDAILEFPQAVYAYCNKHIRKRLPKGDTEDDLDDELE